MPSGRPEPQLDNIASLKLGTMPGLIERFNGQHIVSVTANIHGITLGKRRRKSLVRRWPVPARRREASSWS
jgi:hypothetical protein